jgi:hypothetical protein
MSLSQIVMLIMALACVAQAAIAQEAPAGPTEPAAKDVEPLPKYIEQLSVVSAESDEPIAPLERPLFKYADSTRIIAEGAIWAWGNAGRPIAMAKCWKNANGTQTCAFSLTSDKQVIAYGPQSKTWRPETTQIEPVELVGAPPPDPKDAVRLRQFKEQARRFTAHEFWNPENDRYELRLLPQPVYRYRDEKLKIDDGAIFLLAYDNNPQIILLLEMRNSVEGKARWQYSLARVSSADLRVSLDGKEVWAQGRTPGIVGKPTDFYWHLVTRPEAPTSISPR